MRLDPVGAGLWPCNTSAQPRPDIDATSRMPADRTLGQGHDDQMRRFVDDHDSYLEWLVAHPEGFVINTERSPRAAYVMLHRSSCRTIGGTPTRGGQWTPRLHQGVRGSERARGIRKTRCGWPGATMRTLPLIAALGGIA